MARSCSAEIGPQMSNGGGLRRTLPSLSQQEQPFLMRFASPVLRRGGIELPPGTRYTSVSHETTDDR